MSIVLHRLQSACFGEAWVRLASVYRSCSSSIHLQVCKFPRKGKCCLQKRYRCMTGAFFWTLLTAIFICEWHAKPALSQICNISVHTVICHMSSASQGLLMCRSSPRKSEVALLRSLLSNGQEIWQLPGELSWDEISRVLLR